MAAWWLFACGGDKVECPQGFVESPTGCVRPTAPEPTTPDTDLPIPDIEVLPGVHDLGVVDATCSRTQTLVVRNAGDADLTVTAVDYEADEGALLLEQASIPEFPIELEPGAAFELTVVLTDEVAVVDQGKLIVESNDPDEPRSEWTGTGEVRLGPLVEESVPAPTPLADILLLVDTSCSMAADNTDDVYAGIPEMLTALDAAADWQMGVFSNESGCSNVPFVSDSSPATAVSVANSIFTQPYNLLGESLFALAAEALGQTYGCNAGLLRQGAQLHLIVISDEEEQSGISASTWVSTFSTYSATFVVSAVVDYNATCGDGSGAVGYEEAARLTGGVILDVCQPTWGPQLDSVVTAIEQGVVGPITLSEIAQESTIEVEVDGVPVDSFEYSSGRNSVEDILPPPPRGSTVTIRYHQLPACDE